jgi:hypothetical protein
VIYINSCDFINNVKLYTLDRCIKIKLIITKKKCNNKLKLVGVKKLQGASKMLALNVIIILKPDIDIFFVVFKMDILMSHEYCLVGRNITFYM